MLLMTKELTRLANEEHEAGWSDLQISYGAVLCEAPLGNTCYPLCTMCSLTLARTGTLLLRNKCFFQAASMPQMEGKTSPYASTTCHLHQVEDVMA